MDLETKPIYRRDGKFVSLEYASKELCVWWQRELPETSNDFPGIVDVAPRWVKLSVVATRWSCSVSYVANQCMSGQLRALRLGRSWRTTIEDVVAFEMRYTTKLVPSLEPKLSAGDVPTAPIDAMRVKRQVEKMMRRRRPKNPMRTI